MPLLIDGKKISTEIKDELKVTVEELKKQGVETCLAVIQVEMILHPAFMYVIKKEHVPM
nr:hypothetical protein [Dorea sp. AM58-8]